MSSKPTIVVAHGGWHDPTCFDEVRKQLEGLGYNCHVPDQPSIGDLARTKTSLDTCAHIRSVIQECADRGEDVITTGHSSGGLFCCDAAKGLIKAQRQSEGKPGGVIAVAMIAAFIPPVFAGTGAFKKCPQLDTTWWEIDAEGITFTPRNSQQIFYNDVPQEQADYWSDRLRPMHMPVPHDYYEAWREVPLHYLICENDVAQPLAMQEAMIAAAREEGGNLMTERVATGHSPFLSKPGAVVGWIRRIAGEKVSN